MTARPPTVFITDDLVLHGPIDEERWAREDVTIVRSLRELGGEVITIAKALERFGSGADAAPNQALPALEDVLLIPDHQPPNSHRLEALHKDAVRTFERLFAEAGPVLTRERIDQVRRWRCERGFSWRRVAQRAHVHWAAAWDPPSNQLAGMALCQLSAAALGQNFREPPWNVRTEPCVNCKGTRRWLDFPAGVHRVCPCERIPAMRAQQLASAAAMGVVPDEESLRADMRAMLCDQPEAPPR